MRFLFVLLVLTTATSLTASTARADLILLETDFESGVPPTISGSGTLTGTQGYSALGFGNSFLRSTAGLGTTNGITLTFTDLPSHTSVDLAFFLAIIDSWDGVGDNSNGPDRFAVAIDGTILFSHVFENSGSGTQDYVPPASATLARHVHLGFSSANNFFRDSAYDLGQDVVFSEILHTSSNLTINWFRPDGKGTSDESWAIDNIAVSLGGVSAVPEPSSFVLLWLAGVVLAHRRGRLLPSVPS